MSPASTAVRLSDPASTLAGVAAAAAAVMVLAVGDSVLPAGTRNDYAPLVTAMLAVLAAIGLQRSGSRRTAWAIGAGAVLVLGSVRYIVPVDASSETLTVVGFVAAASSGVLLGAAVAGAWGAVSNQGALIIGAWAAFLTAAAVGAQVPLAAMRWTVPQWLLVVALVALVAAAITVRPGMRVQRPDPRLSVVAVVAAGVLTLGYRLLGELVTSQAVAGAVRMWLVTAVALVAIVIGAELVSRLVPPGDARFVLAATGAVAAGYPLVVELWAGAPWWVLLVTVGAVLVGVRLARYFPYALAGLLVAVVVSVATVWFPDETGDGIPLWVRAALVAAGTGMALAASLPGSVSIAALGLSVPVPAAAVIGAVWVLPADPRWIVLALAATVGACAWQVR
ncbi:hypothetical protein ACIBED_17930 [Rhodococcus coprophilus]|uniref:Hypothetical membrane protein n=1 Tax=Rhodococcus coprophilus TaxID=38310 RepID=A0A2X4UAQ8_9NOCA|nr:hypothetical protein [Rhodococcus coprophilus]MBM7459651.1 hypothetical protein [Rhodococcus coprophilus]SQI36897.1 hypothetical membrane protein [Rhodococcus coprophilus]